MSIILWFHLFFGMFVQAETVQEQYDLGQKYLKRGYYTKALEQFNLVRNYYRDDPLAQMAELAIADVYFKKAEWDLARYSYDDFRRRYPRHEEVDYATYQIGLSLYKKAPKFAGRDQKWTEQTVIAWRGFEKQFPESEYLVDVAEKQQECFDRLAKKELVIAEFYEKRKAWDSVKRRTQGLIQKYPNSEYIDEAYALLAVSFLELEQQKDAEFALERLSAIDPEQAKQIMNKYKK